MKSATAATIWRRHTLAIVVILSVISADLMKWSQRPIQWAGHDAWLSVILAGIAALLLGGLVACAVALYPDARPGGVFVTALRSRVGGFLSLGFVCYTLAEAARALRIAVELLHFAVLPRTPTSVMVAFALLITAVLLAGGIEALLRYQFSVFWPAILLAIASLGLGFRFADWANVLPVLARGATPVIRGIGAMVEPMLGLDLLVVYLPYFLRRGVGTRGALYAVWGGTTAVFGVYLYITMAMLVGFGPFEAAGMTWPEMEAVRRTALTGLFFERLDILFLITLLIGASVALNLYTHAGLETLRQVFALRPRAWQVWVCVLAVGGMALFPANLTEVDWWRDRVLAPLGLLYLIPIPLLLIGAGLFRRYRRRSRALTP